MGDAPAHDARLPADWQLVPYHYTHLPVPGWPVVRIATLIEAFEAREPIVLAAAAYRPAPPREEEDEDAPQLQLEPLPEWCQQSHDSDLYPYTALEKRISPAVVIFCDEAGDVIDEDLGNFSLTDCPIRFSPSLLTTFPPSLEVRLLVPGNQHAALRETFEFGPDFMDVTVEVLPHTDGKVQGARKHDRDIPHRLYGRVGIKLHSGHRPTCTYHQTQAFPEGSVQARFTAAIQQANTIYITCALLRPKKQEPFEAFKKIINDLRPLTHDGTPRNEWYLTRLSGYDGFWPHKFRQFATEQQRELFPMPWHKKPDGKYALMYKKSIRPLRDTFPSVKVYYTHFMSALLYERNHLARLTS